MDMGIVALNCGMTRVFTSTGMSIPVTVVQVEAGHCVSQIKNKETDGYSAIQVISGSRKPSRVNKPLAGHCAKAGIVAGRSLREFRVTEEESAQYKLGDILKVDLFQEGQKIDVVGITKGKGFAGAVKRHHFRTQDNSHGNSISHRSPGSIGQCQTPGRVFKGKKMAGHLGNVRRTARNLQVVRVDAERNLILIKGCVPGAQGSEVVILPTKKKFKLKQEKGGA